jgi:nucleoside-diphosphate-sugar epimerase
VGGLWFCFWRGTSAGVCKGVLMIVGSGLMARVFRSAFEVGRNDVMVYAAGVSNSACTDTREFAREHARLSQALATAQKVETFIYFSTCSVADPEAVGTPYVRHKLAMEEMVRRHSGHLVLRLPQVVGRTPNPHTLLNYLYARISRGERFVIWGRARRNIIDVEDVAMIVKFLVQGRGDAGGGGKVLGETIPVANARDYALAEIVQTLERVTGKRAIFDVAAKGGAYHVDIARIEPLLGMAGVTFDEAYLERVARKYYG